MVIIAWLLRIVSAVMVVGAAMIAVIAVGYRWQVRYDISAAVLFVAAIGLRLAASWIQHRKIQPLRNAIVMAAVLGVGLLFITAAFDLHDVGPSHWSAEHILGVATAVEAYAHDYHRYPQADSIDALARQLEPTYAIKMPREDGWGYPLRYEIRGEKYFIGSPGKFGRWEHASLSDYAKRENTQPDQDIVYGNMNWITAPR